MKKKFVKFLLISTLFSLLGCNETNNLSSSYDESIFLSDNLSSDSSTSKDRPIKSHPFISEESENISSEEDNIISSESSHSSYYSSSSKTSSSSKPTSSSSSKDYEILTTPPNKNNPIDITNWKEFSFVDYLPSDFSYIYGNNKVTPDIYADGGGLVMDKNEGPRKGLQTPYFNTWNKVELRIQLGKFHGTTKSQNKNDPVFTIDCFNETGSLIDTYYIDDIDVSDNSEVKTYIRNSSVCYLEIRATNLPTKSNKVYNFGISGLSLKGWIYD